MKNLFSVFGLTAVLAVAATSAQAQHAVSFGPRLGANLANASLSGPDTDGFNPKAIFGAQVGVTADIQFGGFAFQPSLLFTQKGFKLSQSGTESFGGMTATYSDDRTLHISYLELPLNFVYTTSGDHGLQLFAGPYLAVGVGGSAPYKSDIVIPGFAEEHKSGTGAMKFANQEPNNSSSSSDNDVTVRRFDAGFNAGIGYRQGPVQIQAGTALAWAISFRSQPAAKTVATKPKTACCNCRPTTSSAPSNPGKPSFGTPSIKPRSLWPRGFSLLSIGVHVGQCMHYPADAAVRASMPASTASA